jgi:hypothetical protein
MTTSVTGGGGAEYVPPSNSGPTSTSSTSTNSANTYTSALTADFERILAEYTTTGAPELEAPGVGSRTPISFAPSSGQTLLLAKLAQLINKLLELQQVKIATDEAQMQNTINSGKAKADNALAQAAVRANKLITSAVVSAAQAGVSVGSIGMTAKMRSDTKADTPEPSSQKARVDDAGAGENTPTATPDPNKTVNQTPKDQVAEVDIKPLPDSQTAGLTTNAPPPPPKAGVSSSDTAKSVKPSTEVTGDNSTNTGANGQADNNAETNQVDVTKGTTTPPPKPPPPNNKADKNQQQINDDVVSKTREIQMGAEAINRLIDSAGSTAKAGFETEEGRLQALGETLNTNQTINGVLGEEVRSSMKDVTAAMKSLQDLLNSLSSSTTQNVNAANRA